MRVGAERGTSGHAAGAALFRDPNYSSIRCKEWIAKVLAPETRLAAQWQVRQGPRPRRGTDNGAKKSSPRRYSRCSGVQRWRWCCAVVAVAGPPSARRVCADRARCDAIPAPASPSRRTDSDRGRRTPDRPKRPAGTTRPNVTQPPCAIPSDGRSAVAITAWRTRSHITAVQHELTSASPLR